MHLVIMAAWEWTRMQPLTDTTPKPLLKICWKTIIEHNIEGIIEHFESVYIIVKYKKEKFQEYFWDNYRWKPIRYIEQIEQNGTGAAILSLKGRIEGEFVVVSGDDLYESSDLTNLAEQEGFATLCKAVEIPENFGIFQVNIEGMAVGIIEKPSDPTLGNLANIGCHKFDSTIFWDLEKITLSPRWELEITDLIHQYIGEWKYWVVEAKGRWIAIGYPWHLLSANDAIIGGYTETVNHGGTIEENVTIKGHVYLEEWVIIKSGTYIEGNAYFGKYSIIGPYAHIRWNTSLGENTRIWAFTEVKWSYFWDQTIVAQCTVIVDTVAGNNVNFASGMITTNLRHDNTNIRAMIRGKLIDTGRRKFGTIVGDNVRFWANSTIYPGRTIPTNGTTLPGEIIK